MHEPAQASPPEPEPEEAQPRPACPEDCSGRLRILNVLPVGPDGCRQAVAYCPGEHGEIQHGPFLADATDDGWTNWRSYDPAPCQCGRKGHETCCRTQGVAASA